MGQNLFEELHNKKQQLIALIGKAVQYGWIDSVREKQLLNKIECIFRSIPVHISGV